MGLLSTLMTDGGGRLPRAVKWAAHVARHPGQLASLYAGLNHWSERAVIALTMQTLDNSITVHPKRTRLGRFKLTSEQDTAPRTLRGSLSPTKPCAVSRPRLADFR
jgi:cholesterol oxidase